ncbi:hypothetical protein [Leifsonia sp. 2MCAF36]|uniref:hypothetical protein n=1 Tax=Leifsonia sp. 2MCAF36 TaxID=3232988 RepID=UPI003F9C83B1
MNTSYNRAHDQAQLLARRHERDLHWAKERRRQHEREAAEARVLLATNPLRLAGTTLWTAGALLVAAAGAWGLAIAAAPSFWALIVDAIGVAFALVVLLGAAVSLNRVRRRRAAARSLLHAREARLSHTQFHIHESVHSFIGARVEVVNTREQVSA